MACTKPDWSLCLGHTSPCRRRRGAKPGSNNPKAFFSSAANSMASITMQHLTPCHIPAQPPPEPTLAHACFLPSASSFLICTWNSGCFCTTSWPNLLSTVPGNPCFVPVTWCGFPVGTARDPLQAHTAWACQRLPATLYAAEPSVSTFLSSSLISQMVLCLLAR